MADVWRGTLSVQRALVLSEQLKAHPESHYAAALRGGLQFLGWDSARHLQADLVDQMTILLTGLSGKKAGEHDFVDRPRRTETSNQPKTIAEFNVAEFMSAISR